MNVFEDLAWLPKAPADFSTRLGSALTFTELRALAQYALDDNQLRKLAKKQLSLIPQQDEPTPLTTLGLGLISNATTTTMTPAIQATALRFGINLRVVDAPFNHIAHEAYGDDSFFSDKNINIIFVAIDYRGLPLRACPGSLDEAKHNVSECVSYLRALIGAVKRKNKAQVIVQNIAPPVELLSGSFERLLPGSVAWLIHQINGDIEALAAEDLFILDTAGLASRVGLANWYDPTAWNIGKLAFSPKYIPLFADYLCRLIAARSGKSKRCLILDLDNTIWGGVIGDDGIDGILIGNGDATGEAYVHLQQTVLALRDRGVVLAVSSKNEDYVARSVFKDHPDMLLRENHIAVFQANWIDKATNIRTIAEKLSLGLESMVFLDDNPRERMQVRLELPQVAVPELPEDPAQYAQYLIAAGYFEAITFSDEDKQRAGFYQDNARRIQIQSQHSDINGYLAALEMEIILNEFDAVGRARIAQLISKSNQFNLTSKRYTENEVSEFENNSGYFTRQVRLKDTLGDNGMISVLICSKGELVWRIDTWLMSCRVLGRRVEEAMLQDLVQHALSAGAKSLEGVFVPTARNQIVRDHYKKLGFGMEHTDERGVEVWNLPLASYVSKQLPMKFTYGY